MIGLIVLYHFVNENKALGGNGLVSWIVRCRKTENYTPLPPKQSSQMNVFKEPYCGAAVRM